MKRQEEIFTTYYHVKEANWKIYIIILTTRHPSEGKTD